MTTRSKTRTIDTNAKAPTRELPTSRAPTREAISRGRRGGGSYAVMNTKKSRDARVSVSMLRTADGRIQLAIGEHTVTVTHEEAEALALTLLRMLKSDAV